MRKPAEILDEDHELVIERVCAIDVAKASGMVCTRLPQGAAAGRRVSRVWEVAATTRAVAEDAKEPGRKRMELSADGVLILPSVVQQRVARARGLRRVGRPS